MTDEYKERIIKWLTGNYEEEEIPLQPEPLFYDFNKTTSNINTYISKTIGFIQGKDGKGNDLDIGFIYGNDNQDKGVILVVDKELNILQVIDKFDSGTNFNEFICLNIDTTNGNIYGLDKNGSQYRFILLNNFLIKTPAQKNYTVKLRNSYLLTMSFTPKFVDKKPNEAFYVIIGEDEELPYIATYKIEVGSTNEYLEYHYATAFGDYTTLKEYNIIWSGDSYEIKIGCISTKNITSPDLHYSIYYLEYGFDGTTITQTKTTFLSTDYSSPNRIHTFSSIAITNNHTYVAFSQDNGDSLLVEILYEGEYEWEEFWTLKGDTTLDYAWTVIKIKKLNNRIFLYGLKNIDSPNDNTQTEFKFYLGQLYYTNFTNFIYKECPDTFKLYELYAYQGSAVFSINLFYNINMFYITTSRANYIVSGMQIFNINNWEYIDYQETNSMIPNSVWLYNNNKIIYARNLYNKVVSGNTTTSTVEVPNLLLNNIDIEQQDLLGQTNGILVSNIDTIQKNIYEDLYINFYNTLTMQNQNTQEYITNIVGASRLNGSISNSSGGETYNDVKLTKIRINYSDNTSLVKAINPATRISQFVYQYSFNIYVPGTKDITNIEMISQDEETTYQTITGLSLERSKSYKITQNVEIGE